MVNFEEYRKSTYNWHPGHDKELRITKSSLTSDFDFCPKQYWFSESKGARPQRQMICAEELTSTTPWKFTSLMSGLLSKRF